MIYRLVANTGIVYLTAPAFDRGEYEMLTKEGAHMIYGVALGVAAVSFVLMIWAMEPAYRKTFVGGQTGKGYWREMWESEVLHESYGSVDENRADIIKIHPLYVPHDLAVPWLSAKAVEVNAVAEGGGRAAAPTWLTEAPVCDRMAMALVYWAGEGCVSTKEEKRGHEAVDTLADRLPKSSRRSWLPNSSRKSKLPNSSRRSRQPEEASVAGRAGDGDGAAHAANLEEEAAEESEQARGGEEATHTDVEKGSAKGKADQARNESKAHVDVEAAAETAGQVRNDKGRVEFDNFVKGFEEADQAHSAAAPMRVLGSDDDAGGVRGQLASSWALPPIEFGRRLNPSLSNLVAPAPDQSIGGVAAAAATEQEGKSPVARQQRPSSTDAQRRPSAAAAWKQPSKRRMSRAESLGIPAAMINRRRTATSSADLPIEVIVGKHARELAELMKEAADTEAAVLEYWDVHVTSRGAAGAEELGRELVVRLVEELRPALWVARVFVRV